MSIQFSIPHPLAWIFARKRVPASLLGRLVEQQAPNEAARVIHALRLADSQVPLDELLNRSARKGFNRQPPISGLRPLRRVDQDLERRVPTPPLGVNGDKH